MAKYFLIFFTIINSSLAFAKDSCEGFFSSHSEQEVLDIYEVKKSFLLENLPIEERQFLFDYNKLGAHVRSHIGYEKDKLNQPIPYYEGVLLYYLEILRRIPRDDLKKIDLKIRALISQDTLEAFYSSYNNRVTGESLIKTGELNLSLERISLKWLHQFSAYVLLYESLYYYPLEDSDSRFIKEMMALFIEQMHLMEENKKYWAYQQVFVFDETRIQMFLDLWFYALNPISILDSVSQPYDQVESYARRMRFSFAVHDALHVRDFNLLLDRIKSKILNYNLENEINTLRYRMSKRFSDAYEIPSELVLYRAAFLNFMDQIKDIKDADQVEFYKNIFWYLIHEISSTPFIYTMFWSVNIHLPDSEFKKSQDKEFIKEIKILLGFSIHNESINLWMLPEAWRNNEFLEVEDYVNNFVPKFLDLFHPHKNYRYKVTH